MKIKIINKSEHPLPKYQTEQSAGMDLYANISEPITLNSLERKIILVFNKNTYENNYTNGW